MEPMVASGKKRDSAVCCAACPPSAPEPIRNKWQNVAPCQEFPLALLHFEGKWVVCACKT